LHLDLHTLKLVCPSRHPTPVSDPYTPFHWKQDVGAAVGFFEGWILGALVGRIDFKLSMTGNPSILLTMESTPAIVEMVWLLTDLFAFHWPAAKTAARKATRTNPTNLAPS